MGSGVVQSGLWPLAPAYGAQRSARPTWGVHSTERGRLARGVSVYFVDNGMRRAAECAPYLGSAFDGARASRPRHFGLLCRQRNAARSGVRALPGVCFRRSAGVSPAAFRSALSTTECGAQRSARPTWGLLSTERGRLARGISGLLCRQRNAARSGERALPGVCFRRSAGVSPAAFRSALSTTECGAQRRARPTWGLLSTERGRLSPAAFRSTLSTTECGAQRSARPARYDGLP